MYPPHNEAPYSAALLVRIERLVRVAVFVGEEFGEENLGTKASLGERSGLLCSSPFCGWPQHLRRERCISLCKLAPKSCSLVASWPFWIEVNSRQSIGAPRHSLLPVRTTGLKMAGSSMGPITMVTWNSHRVARSRRYPFATRNIVLRPHGAKLRCARVLNCGNSIGQVPGHVSSR